MELCWLLPKARCQFRLRGELLPLPTDVEGEPEAVFPAEIGDGVPLPRHFQPLRIALSQVELLQLTDQPHRSSRWCLEAGWLEEPLNP